MKNETKETTVAYRCPECGTATLGLSGRFATQAGLVRLKCSCGGSSLDIRAGRDGRVGLSVPCVYCRQNHSYTVQDTLLFDRDLFSLSCPTSGMEIGFSGRRDEVSRAIEAGGNTLSAMMEQLGVQEIREIQPQETAEEDLLPDPTAYDCIRFLMRDLEEEGKIDCPCHIGSGYDLRFITGGIEIFCPECGAVYPFSVDSASSAESYLDLDAITLTDPLK